MNKRLGWIGTGIMGKSMCSHLIQAGYEVSVHTRTASKAEPLVKLGANWCNTPEELAEKCEIVFIMLGFPQETERLVFGHVDESGKKTPGILERLPKEAVLVDMSTNRPELSVRIAEEAAKRGVHALDAPVSGGDIGAQNGTLSIMIGGEKTVAQSLDPLWNLMGKTIVYHGPSGSGQQAKLANQILFATNLSGVCEALLFAVKAGLDPESVLQSVSGGAAGNWALSNLAPRMLRGDFAPGFYVEHLVKDLGLVLDESRRLGIALPGVALINQLYVALTNLGHSRSGSQALVLVLAELNEMTFPSK